MISDSPERQADQARRRLRAVTEAFAFLARILEQVKGITWLEDGTPAIVDKREITPAEVQALRRTVAEHALSNDPDVFSFGLKVALLLDGFDDLIALRDAMAEEITRLVLNEERFKTAIVETLRDFDEHGPPTSLDLLRSALNPIPQTKGRP